jgi:hypothetical protein
MVAHVNPVPSGAVGKDCQRQLLSRPKVRQSLYRHGFIHLFYLMFAKVIDK